MFLEQNKYGKLVHKILNKKRLRFKQFNRALDNYDEFSESLGELIHQKTGLILAEIN
jgi:hypothetical protein